MIDDWNLSSIITSSSDETLMVLSEKTELVSEEHEDCDLKSLLDVLEFK